METGRPELILPEDFEDYAWEVESKGVFWDVRVRSGQQEYSVTFYEPTRLVQDASEQLNEGEPFFEQNIIVIEKVTRDNMILAISKLAADGRIANLKLEKFPESI